MIAHVSMPSQPDVAYSLDEHDAIVGVNEAWDSFAVGNDSSAMMGFRVVGRPIWQFIAGSTTRQLYQRLFVRVRAGAGPVRLEIRCDAPALRRLLAMTITLADDDRLNFLVQTVQLEPREPVALLDPTLPRAGEFVKVCSWCERLEDQAGQWAEVEVAVPRMGLLTEAPLPAITHGVCSDCFTAVIAAINEPVRAAPAVTSLGRLK